jgi:hypothetical protein
MEKEYKFLHFGCWNNLNKDNNLYGVMKKLKEHTQEFPVDFVSISGDNYYPDKVKSPEGVKQKTIIQERLNAGFDCLPEGKFEYIMSMGNHDLETNLYLDGAVERNCHILRSELAKKSDICLFNSKIIEFGNKVTLCLFLDTSIYDESDVGEYLECYKTFIELHPSQFDNELKLLKIELMKTPDILDTHQFKEWVMENVHTDTDETTVSAAAQSMNEQSVSMAMYTMRSTGILQPVIISNSRTELLVLFVRFLQKQYIKKIINELLEQGSSIENVIMIGHHPIVCIKKKEVKTEEGNSFKVKLNSDIHMQFNEFFQSGILSLFDPATITKLPTYYYLCADLHLYQSGVITILPLPTNKYPSDTKIHQYIVGTGGTPLDPGIDDEDIDKMRGKSLSEHIVDYTVEDKNHDFGFLSCTVSPDHSLRSEFIIAPVVEGTCPVKGGTKKYKGRKTRRRYFK